VRRILFVFRRGEKENILNINHNYKTEMKSFSSSKPNVAYLIIREELTSPLIKSQCLDVIEEVNRAEKNCVILVWFYRIDFLLKKKDSLYSLKMQMAEKGIPFVPLPFLSASFPVSWWLLPLVLPQWLIGILFVRVYHGIKLFHCRSYHAGLLGAAFKKLFKIKFLFDPRSPFPEENIQSKRWGEGISLNYLFWKKVETYLVRNADRLILVSRTLKNNYQVIPNKKQVLIVPNNYPSIFESQKIIKNEYVDNYKIDLVYIGSLGHWNQITPYFKFLSDLKTIHRTRITLTFCTQRKNHSNIESVAKSFGLKEEVFTKFIQHQEVVEELSKYTAGIYLMDRKDTRLGVKTVEYMRAGLPVIVSKNIEGAAAVIKSSQMGIVHEHSTESLKQISKFLAKVQQNRDVWRVNAVEYAKNNFSPHLAASYLLYAYEHQKHQL